MPHLELDGVTVTFNGRNALDNVSATFEAGSSSALIGSNGSGKSTLLNVIAKLVTPASGTVHRPDGSKVAFVTQKQRNERWMPLTAGEVLTMGRFARRGLFGRMRSHDRKLIADAADRLNISDAVLSQTFGELSGGQQQRVLVAQALVQEPTILLLDEPVNGLDPPSQQAILDLITDEAARGTIVLVSTHHLDEASHCDQVLLLNNLVAAAGPPDEVLQPEVLEAAFGDRVFDHH